MLEPVPDTKTVSTVAYLTLDVLVTGFSQSVTLMDKARAAIKSDLRGSSNNHLNRSYLHD